MFVIAGCIVLSRKKQKQKRDKNTGRVPRVQPSGRPLNPKGDKMPRVQPSDWPLNPKGDKISERPDPGTGRVDPEISVRPDPKCYDGGKQYAPDP